MVARFEQAGCTIIYGFTTSRCIAKICPSRAARPRLQFITQLGTGNYNEKTAKFYTDFALIPPTPALRCSSQHAARIGVEGLPEAQSVAPIMISSASATCWTSRSPLRAPAGYVRVPEDEPVTALRRSSEDRRGQPRAEV